jgi:Cu+-exporting ATPase
MVKDLICGMEIEPQAAAARRIHMGRTFYFCSMPCAETFDANPYLYAQLSPDNNGVKPVVGSAASSFNPDDYESVVR